MVSMLNGNNWNAKYLLYIHMLLLMTSVELTIDEFKDELKVMDIGQTTYVCVYNEANINKMFTNTKINHT